MAEEDQEEVKPKKPKDWKKIISRSLIMGHFLVLFGGLYVVFSYTVGYQPNKIKEEIERLKYEELRTFMGSYPILYTMDTFVVNLSGKPSMTLQLDLSLEMLSEDGYEEVISNEDEARNEVVNIVNKKEYQDLETIQGKLFLKEQITRAINSHLQEGVVKEIYFSNFLVQ